MHLNEVIAAYAQSRHVVVEWNGAGVNDQQRHWFWTQKFKTTNLHLWYLLNILVFTNWEHRY